MTSIKPPPKYEEIMDAVRKREAKEKRIQLFWNLLSGVGLLIALLSLIPLHNDQVGIATSMVLIGVALFTLAAIGEK